MSTYNQTGINDTVTLSSGYTSDTITLTDPANSSVVSGGYTIGANWPGNLTVGSLNTAGITGAITGGYIPNNTWSNSLSNSTSGTIQLNGDDADININGTSLMAVLNELKERLNWLEPNTTLEKDWDDLRALGEQYRELEKKCKEKAAAWNKLKSMPPPTKP